MSGGMGFEIRMVTGCATLGKVSLTAVGREDCEL